ncbi:MAG: hypothetical protein CMO76_00015 [Verrucomicrobiales bacterium]|nr:hypothetical protein [Verrucomicrobiales bacterium]
MEMSVTLKALQAGLSPEGITLYLFWLGIVGMGAGSLYLFMMQSSLTTTYKKVAIVAGIICGVACFHYYRMSTIYAESLANAITIGEDGSVTIGALEAFPTAYRYIDWLITVPLMVLEFPLLLALSKKSNGLFYRLGFISLAMLVTAWIAETSEVGGVSWWGFYIVACVFWFAMVATLYGQVTQAANNFSDDFKGYLSVMKKYIAIGWIIYPIGFLLALTGNESIREIAYNIADIINKVGFGVASVMAAQVLSKINPEEPLS